jgi:hypothetical protein
MTASETRHTVERDIGHERRVTNAKNHRPDVADVIEQMVACAVIYLQSSLSNNNAVDIRGRNR